MSNSDFEDRLSRIKAAGGQKAASAPGTITGRRAQMNIKGFVVSCFVMGAGLQLIKVANRNYDSIKEEYGVAAALGMGLGSFAVLILSIILFFRAVRPVVPSASVAATGSYQTTLQQPRVQTSAGARAFFSLLGLAMGAIACMFMFVGSGVQRLGTIGEVDKKAADTLFLGSVTIAFTLVAVALLIGFLGLFFRGLPMRRVPVFFFLGAMALYTTFQTLRTHPMNWPTFKAEYIRHLNEQFVE
jgi:hypothetical protein